MTQEALRMALEALEVATTPLAKDRQEVLRAITAIKEALAQTQEPVVYQCPRCATSMQVDLTAKAALAQTQEPVAYDKTEMNCFVQDLYDKKMKEGKHGHYETMFHVVHQAIKRVPPQRTQVDLTDEEVFGLFGRFTAMTGKSWLDLYRMTEAKRKEKNT